jgi:hypothetical protein
MSRPAAPSHGSRWSLIGAADVSTISQTCGPTAAALWVLLDTYADRDGRGAYPRQRHLAEQLGVSVRTVSRCMACLRKNGHITRSKQIMPFGAVTVYECHHLTHVARMT